MDNTDEKILLEGLRVGEVSSFDALYHNYSRQIYRKLLKMIKHPFLAEELTQDVFVKVWEKRSVIDIEKPFSYYILTIANHTVIDLYRKTARDRKLLDEVISFSAEMYNPIEEELYAKESNAILNDAIEKLPDQQKIVFRLCKLEGKTYEEVSAMLGISTSTISNHIVRATKSVKSHFFSSKSGFLLLAVSLFSSKG